MSAATLWKEVGGGNEHLWNDSAEQKNEILKHDMKQNTVS
jgi:hypothetical protein